MKNIFTQRFHSELYVHFSESYIFEIFKIIKVHDLDIVVIN